jgi:hypothetical protein
MLFAQRLQRSNEAKRSRNIFVGYWIIICLEYSNPGKTYRSENFRTASRLPISPTRVPNPTRAAGSKSIC